MKLSGRDGNGGWRKSTYSGMNNGDCVEVFDGRLDVVPVRDSKNPHGPALVFSNEEWSAFIGAIKTGEFSM